MELLLDHAICSQGNSAREQVRELQRSHRRCSVCLKCKSNDSCRKSLDKRCHKAATIRRQIEGVHYTNRLVSGVTLANEQTIVNNARGCVALRKQFKNLG